MKKVPPKEIHRMKRQKKGEGGGGGGQNRDSFAYVLNGWPLIANTAIQNFCLESCSEMLRNIEPQLMYIMMKTLLDNQSISNL